MLTSALAAALALGTAVLIVALAPRDTGDNTGTGSTATPTSGSAANPPAGDVRHVHDALHDIDTQCQNPASATAGARLAHDTDIILTFAQRYPDATFPIDDETGRTLSLLLVARKALSTCAPTEASRVNQSLPPRYRDDPTTPTPP